MEASGNEYAQQLLDRAATLITGISRNEGDSQEAHDWLREYHQEKARFGQPVGSPGYARAAKDFRVEHANDAGNEGLPGVNTARRRLSDARLAGPGGVDAEGNPLPVDVPARDDGSPAQESTDYSDWNLEQLTDEAKRRGLPSSGTKADIRARLEDDDAA